MNTAITLLFRHWESVLKIVDSFEVTANHTLTTLATLPKEWMVEFMFKPTSLNFKGNEYSVYSNMFHMTTGKDSSRTPAVFVRPGGGLHIATGLNNTANFYHDFPTQSTVGEWTKVRVCQEFQNGKLRYKVFLDDVEQLNVVNSKPVELENVKVYTSNPWYQAQPGFIKNLSVNVIKH